MVPLDPNVMFKVYFVYEHLPQGLDKHVLMDKLRIVCSSVLRNMADLAVADSRRFYVGVCCLPGVVGYLCSIGGPMYDAFDFLDYESEDPDADRVYTPQDILNDVKECFERECLDSSLWGKYIDWIRDHVNVESVCNKFAY